MCSDEPPNEATVFSRLPYSLGERPEPEIKRADCEHKTQAGETVLQSVALVAALLEEHGEHREGREGERRREQRPHRTRVSPHVESAAEMQQRNEQEKPDAGLLEIQTLGKVGDRDAEDEHNREVPGPAPSMHE